MPATVQLDPTPTLPASLIADRLLVVFDGQCGLCNRSIRWFLRRDRRDRLRFTPSSNPAIAPLLTAHGLTATAAQSPDSILVLRQIGTPLEELLVRSNAVLAILRALPQPWPLAASLLRLVPRPFRESGYKLIARSRYRIWGRYDTCPIPAPEDQRHFL